MKRYINLLPPEEQKQITAAARRAEVLRFGGWILFTLAVFAAALFAARFALQQQGAALAAELAAKNRQLQQLQSQDLQKDVDEMNRNLKNFSRFAAGGQNWSEIFVELGAVLPAGLTVDQLKIEGEKIEIAGRGATRTAVLKLRQNILASSKFTNVNFPLKNLEKPADTGWSYRFYVKESGIRN